jgi:hypothetical protein
VRDEVDSDGGAQEEPGLPNGSGGTVTSSRCARSSTADDNESICGVTNKLFVDVASRSEDGRLEEGGRSCEVLHASSMKFREVSGPTGPRAALLGSRFHIDCLLVERWVGRAIPNTRMIRALVYVVKEAEK